MDFDDLIWLGVAYLGIRAIEAMGNYEKNVAEPIKKEGAKVYDRIHDDAGHKKDLPGKQIDRNTIFNMVKKYGFFQPDVATAIVMAESGGVPNAIGDNGISIGLFQINTRAWPMYSKEWLANPINNLEAAYSISKGGTDWRPWSTYKTGAYLKHL